MKVAAITISGILIALMAFLVLPRFWPSAPRDVDREATELNMSNVTESSFAAKYELENLNVIVEDLRAQVNLLGTRLKQLEGNYSQVSTLAHDTSISSQEMVGKINSPEPRDGLVGTEFGTVDRINELSQLISAQVPNRSLTEQIGRSLTSDHIEGVNVERIDCRNTLCVTSIAFDTIEAQRQFLTDLPIRMNRDYGAELFFSNDGSSGKPTATIFFTDIGMPRS